MRKSFSMRYPPTHLEVETSDSSPSTSDSIDFCAICGKSDSFSLGTTSGLLNPIPVVPHLTKHHIAFFSSRIQCLLICYCHN